MPQSHKGRETMNRFDTMGKDALSRVEEIMNSTKLNEFLHRKEEEEKKVSVRSRFAGDEGQKGLEEFIAAIMEETAKKEIREVTKEEK